ncbi:MAG: 2-isopropylmalate synthase [bacterium]|nr:2-isopropylmalate synthase [bacterium]
MEVRRLKIFDETLRDGEQQAGISFPPGAKLQLARGIARTGVHQIDVMPAVDASEAALAATLVKEGLGDRLTPATMLGKPSVDQAKASGAGRIILFYALSDRLMFLRDAELRDDPAFAGRTIDDGVPDVVIERLREGVIARVLESLRYATSKGIDLRVDFAAEDASRADPEFLRQCIRAFGPYLEHFMLCDTVGTLRPERAGSWIRELLSPRGVGPLAVHFHNDQGLALENTLQAVLAGATMVSGTFGGIGERAGNVALEQVLDALRVRHGIEVEGIDYDAIPAVIAQLDQLGLRPAPPFSAAAQRHESGIHVHSLLRDPRSYCIFEGVEPEIWFGKMSGTSNFEYLFEKILEQPRPRAEYERMAAALKSRAVAEARCFSPAEVLALVEEGSLIDEVT